MEQVEKWNEDFIPKTRTQKKEKGADNFYFKSGTLRTQ